MSVASVGASVGAGVKKPSSSSSDDKPSVTSTAVKVAQAAAPAVKTASPTTSTAPKKQSYSSSASNESSGTGNKVNSGSGGISAAANVGGGGGTGDGNGGGGNGPNSSGSAGVNAAAKTAGQGVSGRVRADRVDMSSPSWDMLQELAAGSFDNLTPSRIRAAVGPDPFQAEFKPSAAADLYDGIIAPQGGLYQPGPPVMLPPRGLAAAADSHLWGNPGAPITLAHGLASPSSEGGVGTDAISTYLAGLFGKGPHPAASPAPTMASAAVVDPRLAELQRAETWQDPWGQIAAATRTAAVPDRLMPDNMAVTALTDPPVRTAALDGIDAAVAANPQPAGPSAAELALDDKIFGGAADDVFSTDGQMSSPDGTIIRTGVDNRGGTPITVRGGAEEPAKPSTWDNVVDNTGKLLSHTGLGSIVSTLFPDMWSGMGDAFKNMDNGGTGKSGQMVDGDTMTRFMNGGSDPFYTHDNGNGAPAPDTAVLQAAVQTAFPDVNHNGIDDRLENLGGADSASGVGGSQYRSNRHAVFPDMPPYKPGFDNEWDYFRDHLARGGVVGYADGGAVGLGQPDPRVTAIADAEDALHAGQTDHPALAKFAQLFGTSALKQLESHVGEGYSMRPRAARQITGAGGPTDDAVPAMIDGVHPAALSSGEVVIPVDAVAGAGDGDPRVGAERLMALSKKLAKR